MVIVESRRLDDSGRTLLGITRLKMPEPTDLLGTQTASSWQRQPSGNATGRSRTTGGGLAGDLGDNGNGVPEVPWQRPPETDLRQGCQVANLVANLTHVRGRVETSPVPASP